MMCGFRDASSSSKERHDRVRDGWSMWQGLLTSQRAREPRAVGPRDYFITIKRQLLVATFPTARIYLLKVQKSPKQWQELGANRQDMTLWGTFQIQTTAEV